MKFTQRTYKVARNRHLNLLYKLSEGEPASLAFWEAYKQTKRIVDRGRREKGMWNV